jgi:hypothetical protein
MKHIYYSFPIIPDAPDDIEPHFKTVAKYKM